MAKKLENMTRKELLEMYEARGGNLNDFGKNYVSRNDLFNALQELESVLESSAAFSGDFEFVEEEVEDEKSQSAHSDQWYRGRGLQVPKR